MVEAQHPLVATPCAGIEVQLPFGTHRICAVAAASTVAEMRKLVRQAMRFTRTIELRLDWLANGAQRQKFMAWLARSGVRANFIATFRHRAAGGRYTGDIAGQLIVLKQAVEGGCSWCDVEMETASRFRAGVLRALLGPVKLIISFHDFRRTPRKLPRLVRHLESWGADAVKVSAPRISATLCACFHLLGGSETELWCRWGTRRSRSGSLLCATAAHLPMPQSGRRRRRARFPSKPCATFIAQTEFRGGRAFMA